MLNHGLEWVSEHAVQTYPTADSGSTYYISRSVV